MIRKSIFAVATAAAIGAAALIPTEASTGGGVRVVVEWVVAITAAIRATGVAMGEALW